MSPIKSHNNLNQEGFVPKVIKSPESIVAIQQYKTPQSYHSHKKSTLIQSLLKIQHSNTKINVMHIQVLQKVRSGTSVQDIPTYYWF